MKEFKFPTTRYSWSKLKFLDWIWNCVKDIKFNTVLDVFWGTWSVSLLFKKHWKEVFYNDILRFNQIIGKAIIENKNITVTASDIKKILEFSWKIPNYIQKDFKWIFFLDEENMWLDWVLSNIFKLKNEYKQAILLSAVFQSALSKRPFNLFHRINLHIRTASVPRSFWNKTTWETPFEIHLKKFIEQYNRAVFDNWKDNKVIWWYDAINAPNHFDLVYIDPPYFPNDNYNWTNYLYYYSFLERISDYPNREKNMLNVEWSLKRFPDNNYIQNFIKKNEVTNSMKSLLYNFKKSKIILSYQSDWIPSESEIVNIFKELNKKVHVYKKLHKYALSKKTKYELLFISD